MDPKDEELEKAHWKEIIRAFMHYEDFMSMDIAERQNHINRLPTKYVDALPDSTFSKLRLVGDAAKCNQVFFDDLCSFQGYNFGPPPVVSKLINKCKAHMYFSNNIESKCATCMCIPRSQCGRMMAIRFPSRSCTGTR
jgi:hypothetical protein